MNNQYKQYEKTKPILYITQPKSESIFVHMQGIYIGKPMEKEKIKKELLEVETMSNSINDNEGILEMEPSLIEEAPERVTTKNQEEPELQDPLKEVAFTRENESNNRIFYGRKSFKEMSHNEKVYYLLHKPSYIANIPCEITTKESLYTGFVMEYQEGKITMKSHDSIESVLIDMDEILEIKLLSK